MLAACNREAMQHLDEIATKVTPGGARDRTPRSSRLARAMANFKPQSRQSSGQVRMVKEAFNSGFEDGSESLTIRLQNA